MSRAPVTPTASSRPDAPEDASESIAVVAPSTARRRATAAAMATRRAAGRLLLIWIISYLVLRHEGSTVQSAFGAAAFIALAYLPFFERSAISSRTLPASFGAVALPALGIFQGFVAVSALAFWFPGLGLSVESLAAIGVIALLAIIAWDMFGQRTVGVRTRVVVIGGGPQALKLLEDLGSGEGVSRFRLVGLATPAVTPQLRLHGVPIAGIDELDDLIKSTAPDLVVVAVDSGRLEVFDQLLGAAEADFNVVGVPEFYEVAFGRLPVRLLTPAWFMSTLHLYNRPYHRLAKRTFDVVVALLGCLVLLFLLPVIAVIVLSSGRPLVYRQKRLGKHGRVFSMLKFRSMRVDAEQNGAVKAAENDPRVIWGGGLMRKLRLDELPQMINVLKGEMSIVGPRPERPELQDDLPFFRERTLLRPGITGWAQIRSGYAADALQEEQRLSYDFWYLRHCSLLLDMYICLRTVLTLASRSGAR